MNLSLLSYANVKLLLLGEINFALRVSVEHSLARISQWLGDRARYLGTRKNRVDLRLMAVVHNLHVQLGMSEKTAIKAAEILRSNLPLAISICLSIPSTGPTL